ncbi:hypothetical protein T12_16226 [Trichinella patagoniensis]|uniref:Uncharacterized protein n=1 Tax=Trichinella patagoniensis TaxID=990121 RepID=A0A0V0YZJ0_9BILA|nr:hypothetical protein T12_16226 [Trichinella patagoniensis]
MIVHFGEQHIALIMQITIASLLPRESKFKQAYVCKVNTYNAYAFIRRN